MRHLISIRDLSKEEILQFLKLAEKIEKGEIKPDLSPFMLGIIFFEPSTRTRFSFEAAMKRLGGKVLSMSDIRSTSIEKGESLPDTVNTLAQYCDILVIRSKLEGTSRYVSEIVSIPVINAGDGSNQHPTQTLLDLYSILKTQNRLEELKIAIVGDLKYGRTTHSLVYGLSMFPSYLYLVSPKQLKLPDHILEEIKDKFIKIEEVESVESVAKEVDIMYVTRIQRERFPDPEEYEKVKNSYIITRETLHGVKNNLKILHPLPRVTEIAREVDLTPYAYYFQQVKNGLFVRQAILSKLLLGEV